MPAAQVVLPAPAVVGLSPDAAQLQLSNAGLKVVVRPNDGYDPRSSKVVAQLPRPNVIVKAGATVTIYVGPSK